MNLIATAFLIVGAAATCRSRGRLSVRGWHLATRALSVAVLGVTLLEMLPRCKALFLGFGMKLPSIAALVLQLSDFAISRFLELAVFLILAVAVETTFFGSIGLRCEYWSK